MNQKNGYLAIWRNKGMKVELAEHNACTGCGACIKKCPKQCISYQLDELDNLYPCIDRKKCVECGLCMKSCHVIKQVNRKSILKAYASWNTNEDVRRKSASGGVASALYKFCLDNHFHCFGAKFDSDYDVNICEIESYDAISDFRNSKYVFSNMDSSFCIIEDYLKRSESVLFIGLPCQVAALYSFLNYDYSNLVTADLICHGVSSSHYLSEHIYNVVPESGSTICFRDPEFGTESFHFTIRHADHSLLYNKAPIDNDVYQIGYHNAVIYRPNCYRCLYANKDRVGDITLGDYWKLGYTIPFEYSKDNVSLVYSNTNKGESLLHEVENSGGLVIFDRPISESLGVQSQLNRPSFISKECIKFNKAYKNCKQFDKAAKKAVKADIIFNSLKLYRVKSTYKKIRRKIWGT